MVKLNNILFFSNNKGKVKEVKNLFKETNINILSLSEIGIKNEPVEYGKTFFENAKIKSCYGFNETGIPCFADDSGICIEALNWKPEIHSRNFIDSFSNNNECFNYIIKQVNKTGKKRAYFKTCICYTIKKNTNIYFEGTIKGNISGKILGDNGFGYDPIFKPDGFKKTFGQMTRVEKNLLSHRSIALNKLINFLPN